MNCTYNCNQGKDCTCKPLPIQMAEDDMDAPWWEFVVIVVALVLAFTFGVYVGRWTA